MENRQYERVKAKSILVSLSNQTQQVTGFLRDISEGGLKIQKILADWVAGVWFNQHQSNSYRNRRQPGEIRGDVD